MKASKMKENLINDKEQAYLSKTSQPSIPMRLLKLGWQYLFGSSSRKSLPSFSEEMGFAEAAHEKRTKTRCA